MSLTASSSYTVSDQTALTASASTVVLPAVGSSTGRGRLIHPTLGTYDYAHTPTHVLGVDGDIIFGPQWAHSVTLGGGADALWSGKMRDALITERWVNGDTGGVIGHLRALAAFFMNPPDPTANSFVTWQPNYLNANSYKVALIGVRSGGTGYTLDVRLLRYGYAPQPVELDIRILGYS